MRNEYICHHNTDPVRRKYRKFLIILFSITLIGIAVYSYCKVNSLIPERIRIIAGKEQNFNLSVPMQADILTDNVSVTQINKSNIPAGSLKVDLNEPFTIRAEQTGSYKVVVKLFGLISMKEISLDVIDTVEVMPCGATIGITLNTDGILVLGTAKVTGQDKMSYEPSVNHLRTGDYIVEANGKSIECKEDLIRFIQKNGLNRISFKVKRDGQYITTSVTPIETAEGEYKIGCWIRDDTQGIGTLTFITNTGQFGALGHGITDVDTGLLMQVGEGNIYNADVVNIIKGKPGTPGELSGIIHENERCRIGEIRTNTRQGIFGRVASCHQVDDALTTKAYQHPIQIGLKQDVKVGPATILCNIDGEIKEYDIQIKEIDFGNTKSKGLVIQIVDETLKQMTGGIVQGMSGSPIIQDNKLIGAVTHVFIRDATMGYGTFIENMLQILQ